MKKFDTHAAQGEIYIQKISGVPEGVVAVAVEKGKFVISHSESGNSHVIDADDGVTVMEKPDAPEGMRLLYALLEKPTTLYQDAATPHDKIHLEPGIYAFRVAREFDPFAEQVRLVAD